MNVDERFTNISDIVSEAVGKWWVTACSVLIVAIWLITGPFFHFSDTWQLLINTPTTVLEMWLGFLCCAAANRVEKRNWELHVKMVEMLKEIQKLDQRAIEDLERKV